MRQFSYYASSRTTQMNAISTTLHEPIERTAATAPKAGSVRVYGDGCLDCFDAPIEVVAAESLDQVWPAMETVDRLVGKGLHAAGFVSYEAAPAFDSALSVHTPGGVPLVWFGVYDGITRAPIELHSAPQQNVAWRTSLTRNAFEAVIEHIRQYIAAGDTYQVNFTFPLLAQLDGDAWARFQALIAGQPAHACMYIDTGKLAIMSMSPELFFSIDNETLTMRPMKGTRPRGRFREEDERLSRDLAESAKDRAENVMIVDMVRNDMGRISDAGTVHVDRLFEVERFDTVWQMTSTIRSQTTARVPEIFRALFPSGSVTGAPKVRTMEIIRELEPAPRGVYCGAMGTWGPGRRASFRIGIRTLILDKASGDAAYHVGSGVTWDSLPAVEYDECLAKAAVVVRPRPAFDLIETMLYEPVTGFFLLDGHLSRLESSAAYFGFECDVVSIRAQLEREARALAPGMAQRVRLVLDRVGRPVTEWRDCAPARPFRVALAMTPIDSSDVFLFHKTTNRRVYDERRAALPDCDDVILWNERGELTETTIGNLVLEIRGVNYTPPLTCGLLGGVMRDHLLRSGLVQERVLLKDDLRQANAIGMVNSVRGWVRCCCGEIG